jgi:hypothetical protein
MQQQWGLLFSLWSVPVMTSGNNRPTQQSKCSKNISLGLHYQIILKTRKGSLWRITETTARIITHSHKLGPLATGGNQDCLNHD